MQNGNSQQTLMEEEGVVRREVEYHERLYSGFAQTHFARPAVRALRQHMTDRILQVTGAGSRSRVLSLGCGIGDTELLLARRVRSMTGIDVSPSAIRQAQTDALDSNVTNATFVETSVAQIDGTYDLVIAVFFLHHLSLRSLEALPAQVMRLLAPGGVFYSVDPSSRRLSGQVGRLLIPSMMKRYQSPDERELDPEWTTDLFARGGFASRADTYDFGSTPLAGLLPAWAFGYRAARRVDDVLLRAPWLRQVGSNFEVIAQR